MKHGFDHRVVQVGKRAIHCWMEDNFPRTGRCEWCASTDRKTEYACPGHRYTRNRADWLELCRRYHRRIDGSYKRTREHRAATAARNQARKQSAGEIERRAAKHRGMKRSAATRARISAGRKAYFQQKRGSSDDS